MFTGTTALAVKLFTRVSVQRALPNELSHCHVVGGALDVVSTGVAHPVNKG